MERALNKQATPTKIKKSYKERKNHLTEAKKKGIKKATKGNNAIPTTNNGGNTMAKRSEVKARKEEAIQFICKLAKTRGKAVRITDLYDYFADVWNGKQYFVQDVIRNMPADYKVNTFKKGGTFVVYTDFPYNPTVKQVVMGGIAPVMYEGRFTFARPEKLGGVKLNKIPKMLDLPETRAVYRIDRENAPSEYVQVTPAGNFRFQRV